MQQIDYNTQLYNLPTGTSVPATSITNVLSRDKDLSGGTYQYARTQDQSVAASSTLALLNFTGTASGLVTHIFVTLTPANGSANTDMLRESHIKIYYDGNVDADIDAPLDMFFAAEYAGDTQISSFASEFVGMASAYDDVYVSYYLNIPIPFNTGIKIEFVNGSASIAARVWADIDYFTGVANNWTGGKKLKVSSGTLTNQAVDTLITLVNVSGTNPGRLIGVYMAIDGQPNTANPRGAAVEGDVKIYKDGGGTPLYWSSGFEDYFGFGFSFMGMAAPANSYQAGPITPYAGCTFRNTTPGTFQAYRFHILDPIYFTNALKVTWNCGDSSQANFTGGERVAWCVWYYTS